MLMPARVRRPVAEDSQTPTRMQGRGGPPAGSRRAAAKDQVEEGIGGLDN